MRIGHCQFESIPGDFEGNLAKVVKGLEQADGERVQVVCFPECFLTGYQDTEVMVRAAAFAADSPQMMKLLDRISGFHATCIVGYNERRHQEDFIFADVDPEMAEDKAWGVGRSLWSAREFGKALLAVAEQADGEK